MNMQAAKHKSKIYVSPSADCIKRKGHKPSILPSKCVSSKKIVQSTEPQYSRPSIDCWVLKSEKSSPRWEEQNDKHFVQKSGDGVDNFIFKEKLKLKFQRSSKKSSGDSRDESQLARNFCVLFGHNICHELHQTADKKLTNRSRDVTKKIQGELLKWMNCYEPDSSYSNINQQMSKEFARKITIWLETVINTVEHRNQAHFKNIAREDCENDNAVFNMLDNNLDTIMNNLHDNWSVCTSEIFEPNNQYIN